MRVVSIAASLVVGSGAASAGGIIVPGFGSQAQPRAGAFVAKADDPTALYYNPAGFARQRGTRLHLGFNLIDFDQRFQRAGAYEAPGGDEPDPAWTGDPYPEVENQAEPAIGLGGFQAVPTLALATDLGGRSPVVFGLGLVAEHGYPNRDYGALGSGSTFEDPDNPPPPQRYDVLSSEVTVVFPSLAAAYSFGDLDVGVRASWGVAHLKGVTDVWALRNYEEDHHADARVSLDAKDSFVPAAQIGVLYRPHPTIEIGAQYTTKRSIAAKGEGQAPLGDHAELAGEQDFIAPITGPDAQCADGGTLTRLKACVDLAVPQTATLGVRYVMRDGAGRERGDVELDVQWEDWSDASDVRVLFDGRSGLTGLILNETFSRHGFRDTYSVRLGGAYGIPVGDDLLAVRAGVAHDTAAAPVSWTRTDLDGMARTTFGLGLGYDLGKVRFDLGGGYVHEGVRAVTNACNPVTADPGCAGSGMETPVDEREAPDPVQPGSGPKNQVESPYNAGTYRQHYVLVSLGATYLF